MNQRFAKALRRKARELTVGQPALAYIDQRRMRRLYPQCTRAVYQRMKRVAKQAHIV